MKTITKKLLVLGMMFVSIGIFAADVPEYINYQGLLAKDGVAVNGQRNIIFRLYNAPTQGTSLLQNGSFTMSVQVVDGVFNVNMGPFTPADRMTFASHKDIYLEIEIEGEVFPRQQMLSVGYAFRAQIAAGVDDNAIDSAKIADDTIVSADIQNKTIQIEDLADEVLDGGGVANGSITTEKLADGAVSSQKIAYETIVSTNIRDGSIIEVNISDDAVTTNKIINNAVNTSKIADSAVTTAKIADGAVTAAKLASGSIPSSIPTGGIIMWTGTVPPAGWSLCDGSNGTPDLRNRFIVAWGSSYGIGATGGSNTTTLSVANLPSHTHSVTGDTGVQSNSHTHSGTTDGDGNHRHGIEYRAQTSTGDMGGSSHTGLGINNWATHDPNTDYNGNHTHTFSTGVNNSNHTHTINFTSGSTGSGTAIENRSPYYALAFIMKL